MPLETQYKNPEVILTLAASGRQQDYVRYLKCVGLLSITLFVAFFSGIESWLLSISVVVFFIALVMLVLNRPRIVMNNIKKHILVTGNQDGSNIHKFPHGWVEKIRVRSRVVKRGHNGSGVSSREAGINSKRKQNTRYFSEIFIRDQTSKKRRPKTAVIETFELSDIIEAHYIAQLLASFTDAKAIDVQGRMLPPTKSHIPTKYLREDH